EVVSRIEHRGNTRARVVPVAFDGFAPEPGASVMAGEKTVGTLGSTANGQGLALLRLDRAEDAIHAGAPLICGNVTLRLIRPEGGLFSVPRRSGHGGKESRRMIARAAHGDGLYRCGWAGDDPLYVAYHDEEWGVPEYDDRALYEKLMLDGFQAGLSWITILRK